MGIEFSVFKLSAFFWEECKRHNLYQLTENIGRIEIGNSNLHFLKYVILLQECHTQFRRRIDPLWGEKQRTY